jgi:Flp pilus assembly protein TadB
MNAQVAKWAKRATQKPRKIIRKILEFITLSLAILYMNFAMWANRSKRSKQSAREWKLQSQSQRGLNGRHDRHQQNKSIPSLFKTALRIDSDRCSYHKKPLKN